MTKQAARPDLSVIVVNWNTRSLLEDCLESLFADPESDTWEVIVIDNASSDGSVEMIRDRFPKAVLVVNATNRGFVGGNNVGLQAATGPYILLLNTDTVVEPDALPHLTRFMAREPEAGAVGPKLLNPDGTLQLSCGIHPHVLERVREQALVA